MPAILLPNGKQQFFTTPGVPAVGYKIATFAAGTSSNQTTWADALQVGANANPIILDARGEAVIFWNGAYKVQLQDSTGAVIWTVDNVQSQPAPSASLVPSVDNSFTLGSATFSWANVYVGANHAPVLDTVSGNIGYYRRTDAEIAASVTPSNFSFEPWRGEDVRRIGVTGNGTTDDRAALFIANSIGSALYFPPGTYKISSNLTLGVPLLMDYGAIIKPDAGITVTINAPISAGPWQIFNVSNAGAVITGLVRPATYGARIPVEWFGAVGNNVTDDKTAFQATAKLAADAGYIGIQLQAKLYYISGTVYAGGANTNSFYSPSWYGVEKRKTQVQLRGAGVVPAFLFRGGSGQSCGATVDDIGFNGDANSIGISFSGQCGMKVRRCLFDLNILGLQFKNDDSGSFTEFCVAEDCEWTQLSASDVQYFWNNASGATASFHGSGVMRGLTSKLGGGATQSILIGSGCHVYSAPMDLQIFNATAMPLINNQSSLVTSFYGNINVESSTIVTLGSGGLIYHTGKIITNSEFVTGGTLAFCDVIQANSNGSLTILGVRRAFSQAAVTGANTLNSFDAGGTRFIDVHVFGTGYDWRGTYFVVPSGTGAAGSAYTIGTNLFVNTAAYGAPVATVSTAGNLVLTNGAYPASGVTITYAEKGIGPGPYGSFLSTL